MPLICQISVLRAITPSIDIRVEYHNNNNNNPSIHIKTSAQKHLVSLCGLSIHFYWQGLFVHMAQFRRMAIHVLYDKVGTSLTLTQP